ncbi:hypothetical protein [Nocardioides sp. SYSU D00038]|uniref:hypothetical protein n=1 Tax=Nocardioides sp. SYSU D00038 TaxID=2812554 RepID=UPI0019681E39|nr:hypothetical protein [Nocardioides sp. SYSU D00038]
MGIKSTLDGVRHSWFGRALRFRPVAVVLAVLFVFATASATADAPSGDVVYGKLKGQDVRLSIPATAHPKGIAIFFHGQTGGVDNRMDEPWLQALLRSGWIIGSSDFHTASWGNAASTDDTVQLVRWAEEQTGHRVKLFVSGSMGASVSLNAMAHGVKAPRCWYGVKPAVDLTTMGNVPGANRIISEAYGGQPVPADRNPVENIGSYSTDTVYRMVSSFQDTWVPRTTNAGRLAEGLAARGAEVSILDVVGGHDDPSHFNATDLVTFGSRCA